MLWFSSLGASESLPIRSEKALGYALHCVVDVRLVHKLSYDQMSQIINRLLRFMMVTVRSGIDSDVSTHFR